MKTKLFNSILAFSFCVLWSILPTQAQTFEKGDKLLNITAGLGNQFAAAGAKSLPPIGLSFEAGINDKISIGGYGAYSTAKVSTIVGDWNYNYIIVGARGSYHFDFKVKNLDPYVGAMAGYNIASVKTSGNLGALGNTAAGGFIWAAHAGARYYFSPNFGVVAELGYGVAWLNAGITLKF